MENLGATPPMAAALSQEAPGDLTSLTMKNGEIIGLGQLEKWATGRYFLKWTNGRVFLNGLKRILGEFHGVQEDWNGNSRGCKQSLNHCGYWV